MEASARRLLRLEGAAVLLLSVVLYAAGGASWWLFAGLLLVPDLAMVGYLAGPRVGAAAYNAVHAYVLPLALAAAGVLVDRPEAVSAALVWTAHIGMDRMVGYGLKAPTGFRETHLGPIGRPR